MKIIISLSSLRQTSTKEYALRFALGGLVTALAGVIANEFGPVIGGLFLAFPSIFPAAVTLVEKHEAQKKKKKAAHGRDQARCAAGADAAGAAMGSFGLLAFGLIVWKWAADYAPAIVLSSALLAWMLTAIIIWVIRKKL
jgi:uncharacterized protein DUF3147